MIWTPHCPVFRDDDGNLLEKPYLVDILTAPAPNVRALKEAGDYNHKEINRILRERIGKILRIFDEQECRVLVLGAWGCGVFGNHPNTVAAIFSDYLCRDNGPYESDALFHNRFERIRFAIHGSETNLDKFFTTWFDIE